MPTSTSATCHRPAVSSATSQVVAAVCPRTSPPASACSSTDAYARGWDPTHAVGSSCGAPAGGGTARPVSVSQVYHFLQVTVSGTDITVRPTDSSGAVFDQVTYHFGPDTTPPTTPGAPSASRVGTTTKVTVKLGAAASDDVAMLAYDVYRDQVYRGIVPAGATTWTDPLVPAGTHTWTVQARDLRGNASATSAPSGSVTLPDTSAPIPPTLTALGRSGGIDLRWSGATDDVAVATYDVYRDGAASPAASGLTGTTWSDTQVVPGQSYSYAVVARDAAGNSSTPSNTVTAASSAASTLGPPTNLTAVQLNAPGQVALSWSAPTSGAASSYDVTRDGTQLTAGTTSTSVTDPSAPDGTPSRYTVIARDDAGSTASATLSVTPDWTAPTPPGAVSVTPQSASSVAVTWGLSSDAVGVTGYTVTRTDPGGGTTQVAQEPGTGPVSVLDSGLTPGTTYTYAVTAADAAGNRATSSGAVTLPVFAEDFESGQMSGGANPWSAPTNGLALQQSTVHRGTWAAVETSTGSADLVIGPAARHVPSRARVRVGAGEEPQHLRRVTRAPQRHRRLHRLPLRERGR